MTRETSTTRCPWCAEGCRYWGLETCPFRPRQMPRSPKSQAWERLLHLTPGNIVMFSELVAQQASGETAESALHEALAAGIVEPVYTLRVQPLEPVPWTPDLMSLRHHFTSADGQDIDGRDPAQILVGFRRLQRGKEP